MNESLIQILLIVLILATVALIAVLWRLFLVLGDVKETTGMINRRVQQVDRFAERLKESLKDGISLARGFVHSLDFVKTIKNKIGKF